jgi:hypothetical protein
VAILLWRGAGHWPGKDARRSIIFGILGEWDVDVFEESLGGDATDAVGILNQVVARTAGLFAAQRIDKDERFGELTSAHQEASAVDGPLTFKILTFKIHNAFFHPGWGLLELARTRWIFVSK